MSYQLYNLLHILGIVLVFMAIGALAFHGANGGSKDSNKVRGLLMGSHGVGMLLIVIAGFGMLARSRSMAGGIPGWIHPKLLIWVLLGAAPALLNRKPNLGKMMWLLAPLLAAVAAYFALNHPGESSASPDETKAPASTQS